jgi:hypothetical protein
VIGELHEIFDVGKWKRNCLLQLNGRVIIEIGWRRKQEALDYGKRENLWEMGRERRREREEGKGMSHVWWLSFRMSNQEGTWVDWCRPGKWS